MAPRQRFPLQKGKVTPNQLPPPEAHTHRGHQLGEVGRAGARCPERTGRPSPGPVPPPPPRPRLSLLPPPPAPLRKEDAPASPGDPRQDGEGGKEPLSKDVPSLASPASSAPAMGGLRSGARGLGSSEPRHLLTVTGGASSSHLPSCFLAF